jgi:D-alanyl-D-alanine carboxypeptidase
VNDLGIPADYGTIRGLSLQPEESDLVSIGTNPFGKEILLSRPAAAAWARLAAAARADDVAIVPISGFRSVVRQREIIRQKMDAGEPLEAILRTVAAPGYSEHHTGRALDVGEPDTPALTEAFASTPAFRWLEDHAPHLGFCLSFPRGNPHGIAYEPWHWCYRER